MGTELQAAPGGAVAVSSRDTAISTAQLLDRRRMIQAVMRDVMVENVHYGKIPGTDKPALLKAGSEALLMTFQIAVTVLPEDLSTDDCVRYRVRILGTHTPSGAIVGEGVGECSSDEEKYRWRKAGDSEFKHAPESRRRVKYGYGRNGEYSINQVRTNPADVANTILKMAKKRAQIDMTLTALACSDMFEQDLEEMTEEEREQRIANDGGRGGRKPTSQAAARPKPDVSNSPERAKAIADLEKIATAADRMSQDGGDRLLDAWGDLPEATRALVGADFGRIRKLTAGGAS